MNINSSYIKVYPTASRSPEIDYAANLNIEQNIVALSNNITDYNSYIVDGLDIAVVKLSSDYLGAISIGRFVFKGYNIQLIEPSIVGNIVASYTFTGMGKTIVIPPGGTSFTGEQIVFGSEDDEVLLDGTLNTNGSRVLYKFNIYIYDTNLQCYVFNNPLIDTSSEDPNNRIYFEISNETTGIIKIVDKLNKYVNINDEVYFILDDSLNLTGVNQIYSSIDIQSYQVGDTSTQVNRLSGIDGIDGTYTGVTFNIRTLVLQELGTNEFELGTVEYISNEDTWIINKTDKNVKFNANKVNVKLNKNYGLVSDDYDGSFIDLLKDYLIIDDGKVGNNIED